MNLSDCILIDQLSRKYRRDLNKLEIYLETRLDLIQRYFPDFTDHGIGHSKRVLKSFCEILTKRNIAHELGETNALLGICACLLHDIGMGPITSEEIRKSIDPNFRVNKIWRDTVVRETHHERTSTWILESEEFEHELSWFPTELRTQLAAIAKAHRHIRIHEDPILKHDLNLQFLSALLRLADQMDLSEDRVTYFGYYRDNLPTRNEAQTREFAKSLCAAEAYLSDEDDKLILKSTQPFDNVVILMLDALYDLTEDIERTIEQTKIYSWQGKSVLPNALSYDFHVMGEDTQEHCLGAHFQNVLKYLSTTIYAGQEKREIPFREAISNAIDSCTLQKLSDESSSCEIHIVHRDDEIWIWDNGRGMTPRVIENYLKILGASYYESPWFKGDSTLPNDTAIPLIGIYGIGIFSYLLVSDEFEIITASVSSEPRRVVFSRRFAITLGPLPASDLTRGTIVILKKPRRNVERWPTQNEVENIVKKWFPCPPIPMHIHTESGEIELSKMQQMIFHHISITPHEIRLKHDDYLLVDNDISVKTQINIEITAQIEPTNESRSIEINDILQVRGVRIPFSTSPLLPFTVALLSLPEIFQKFYGNCSGRLLILSELDGKKIIPTITKTQLVQNDSRDKAFSTRENQIEIIAAKFFSKFLQNQTLDWSIREQARRIIFNQLITGYGNYRIYEKIDGLSQSLITEMRFYDWETDSYFYFENLQEISNTHTICVSPIESVERNLEIYTTRDLLILHPLLLSKYKNRKKVLYANVVGKYKKWFGKKVKFPKFLFIEYGQTIMVGSLSFLKWILKQVGIEDWIILGANPYHLKKNAYPYDSYFF
jgi:hypothetical protein